MTEGARTGGMYPALLKHWRRRRGMSQLDLAAFADISSRHLSFLETGRSRPSEDMVLRLASALAVPLRHVDAMLVAAGYASAHEQPADLADTIRDAIDMMKAHHDPYPLIVVDRAYRVLDANAGARALLGTLLGDASALDDGELNLAVTTFDPAGAKPYLVNFHEVGRELLWRIEREVLAAPDADDLRELLARIHALPTVPADWRDVDLSTPSEPALTVHLRSGDIDLRFLVAVTAFEAPQNVAVETLRIETWFPADAATRDACALLAAHGDAHGATSS